MNEIFYSVSLCLGILACFGDILVPFILGAKKENYNHFYDVISELGTKESPTHKQASIWLIVFGLLFVLFAIGFWIKIGISPSINLAFVLSMISFGIGAGIICGIFPEDSKGEPETIHGKIHGISAGLGSIGLLLSPLFACWIKALPVNEFISCIVFILPLISFSLFLGSKRKVKVEGTGVVAAAGLWQRLFLIVCYGFLVVNGIMLV